MLGISNSLCTMLNIYIYIYIYIYILYIELFLKLDSPKKVSYRVCDVVKLFNKKYSKYFIDVFKVIMQNNFIHSLRIPDFCSFFFVFLMQLIYFFPLGYVENHWGGGGGNNHMYAKSKQYC